jgi:RNA polymerase-interacting CarD/CdnL/TRCF family regulator
MNVFIGDKLIHPTYGLGYIAGIEIKPIDGVLTNCFVFQTPDLSLWIPIDKLHQHLMQPHDVQEGRNQGPAPA